MNRTTIANELPADPHEAAAVLLGRIAQGADKEAFSELYDRFSGALFAVILSIVRDRDEAEDTLQECFCSVWDHADQYDACRGKAVSWLMTIARNKAYDYVAKAKRRGKISERVLDESVPAVDRDAFVQVATTEEAVAVRDALAGLPGDQREAIQMTFINGMSQSEVAQALDQPLGTIKARIRRGLFQLRGVLQPYLVHSNA